MFGVIASVGTKDRAKSARPASSRPRTAAKGGGKSSAIDWKRAFPGDPGSILSLLSSDLTNTAPRMASFNVSFHTLIIGGSQTWHANQIVLKVSILPLPGNSVAFHPSSTATTAANEFDFGGKTAVMNVGEGSFRSRVFKMGEFPRLTVHVCSSNGQLLSFTEFYLPGLLQYHTGEVIQAKMVSTDPAVVWDATLLFEIHPVANQFERLAPTSSSPPRAAQAIAQPVQRPQCNFLSMVMELSIFAVLNSKQETLPAYTATYCLTACAQSGEVSGRLSISHGGQPTPCTALLQSSLPAADVILLQVSSSESPIGILRIPLMTIFSMVAQDLALPVALDLWPMDALFSVQKNSSIVGKIALSARIASAIPKPLPTEIQPEAEATKDAAELKELDRTTSTMPASLFSNAPVRSCSGIATILVKGLAIGRGGNGIASRSSAAFSAPQSRVVVQQFVVEVLVDGRKTLFNPAALTLLPNSADLAGTLVWDALVSVPVAWTLMQRDCLLLRIKVYVEESSHSNGKRAAGAPSRALVGTQVVDLATAVQVSGQIVASAIPLATMGEGSAGDSSFGSSWVIAGFVFSPEPAGSDEPSALVRSALAAAWEVFQQVPCIAQLSALTVLPRQGLTPALSSPLSTIPTDESLWRIRPSDALLLRRPNVEKLPLQVALSALAFNAIDARSLWLTPGRSAAASGGGKVVLRVISADGSRESDGWVDFSTGGTMWTTPDLTVPLGLASDHILLGMIFVTLLVPLASGVAGEDLREIGTATVVLPVGPLLSGMPLNLTLPLRSTESNTGNARIALLAMSVHASQSAAASQVSTIPAASLSLPLPLLAPARPGRHLRVKFTEGHIGGSKVESRFSASNRTARELFFEAMLLLSPSLQMQSKPRVSRTGLLPPAMDQANTVWPQALSCRLSLDEDVLLALQYRRTGSKAKGSGKRLPAAEGPYDAESEEPATLSIVCRDASLPTCPELGRAAIVLSRELFSSTEDDVLALWATILSTKSADETASNQVVAIGRVRIEVQLCEESSAPVPGVGGLAAVCVRCEGVNERRGGSDSYDPVMQASASSFVPSLVLPASSSSPMADVRLGTESSDLASGASTLFDRAALSLANPPAPTPSTGALEGAVCVALARGEVVVSVRTETGLSDCEASFPVARLLPRRAAYSASPPPLSCPSLELALRRGQREPLAGFPTSNGLGAGRGNGQSATHIGLGKYDPRLKLSACMVPFVAGDLVIALDKVTLRALLPRAIAERFTGQRSVIRYALGTSFAFSQPLQVLGSSERPTNSGSNTAMLRVSTQELLARDREEGSTEKFSGALLPLIIRLVTSPESVAGAGFYESRADWLLGCLDTAPLYMEALRDLLSLPMCATWNRNPTWRISAVPLFSSQLQGQVIADAYLRIGFVVRSIPRSCTEPIERLMNPAESASTSTDASERTELALKQAFLVADKDASGTVSTEEVLSVIRAGAPRGGPSPTSILHTPVGLENTASLLQTLCPETSSEAHLTIEERVSQMFHALDVDGDGTITWWEWRSVLAASLARQKSLVRGWEGTMDPLVITLYAALAALRSLPPNPDVGCFSEEFDPSQPLGSIQCAVMKDPAATGPGGNGYLMHGTSIPPQSSLSEVGSEAYTARSGGLRRKMHALQQVNHMLTRRLEDVLMGLPGAESAAGSPSRSFAHEPNHDLLRQVDTLQSQSNQYLASLQELMREKDRLAEELLRQRSAQTTGANARDWQQQQYLQQEAHLREQIDQLSKELQSLQAVKARRLRATVTLQLFFHKRVLPYVRGILARRQQDKLCSILTSQISRQRVQKRKQQKIAAALAIQRIVRGVLDRTRLRKRRSAAITIQCAVRKRQARNTLHELRAEACAVRQKQKLRLFVELVYWYRRYRRRRVRRLRDKAARMVTRAFRSYTSRLCGRRQRTELLAQKRASFERSEQEAAAAAIKNALKNKLNRDKAKEDRQQRLSMLAFINTRRQLKCREKPPFETANDGFWVADGRRQADMQAADSVSAGSISGIPLAAVGRVTSSEEPQRLLTVQLLDAVDESEVMRPGADSITFSTSVLPYDHPHLVWFHSTAAAAPPSPTEISSTLPAEPEPEPELVESDNDMEFIPSLARCVEDKHYFILYHRGGEEMESWPAQVLGHDAEQGRIKVYFPPQEDPLSAPLSLEDDVGNERTAWLNYDDPYITWYRYDTPLFKKHSAQEKRLAKSPRRDAASPSNAVPMAPTIYTLNEAYTLTYSTGDSGMLSGKVLDVDTATERVAVQFQGVEDPGLGMQWLDFDDPGIAWFLRGKRCMAVGSSDGVDDEPISRLLSTVPSPAKASSMAPLEPNSPQITKPVALVKGAPKHLDGEKEKVLSTTVPAALNGRSRATDAGPLMKRTEGKDSNAPTKPAPSLSDSPQDKPTRNETDRRPDSHQPSTSQHPTSSPNPLTLKLSNTGDESSPPVKRPISPGTPRRGRRRTQPSPSSGTSAAIPVDVDLAQIVSSGQTMELDALHRAGRLAEMSNVNVAIPFKRSPTLQEQLYPPLLVAVMGNHADVLALLLQHPEIDLNSTDTQGNSAILCAAELGHTQCFQLLLQHPRVDVNKQDHRGHTALISAILALREAEVKLLLADDRVEVNLHQNARGWTALIAAVIVRSPSILRLLLDDRRILVNEVDKSGKTALIYAATYGLDEMVLALLEHPDIDVNCRGQDGKTALGVLKPEKTELRKRLLDKAAIE